MSTSPSDIDPQVFRRLLGSFATGVTVITAHDGDGQPAGMTASAVSAVSLDPPILLVCVGHDASLHPTLSAVDRFALNVLAADQETVSRQFAAELDDRFDGIGYRRHASGLPLLDDVVAHIVCERHDTVTAGDHTVFFGRVVDGEAFERQPLLHFRGGYRAPGGA